MQYTDKEYLVPNNLGIIKKEQYSTVNKLAVLLAKVYKECNDNQIEIGFRGSWTKSQALNAVNEKVPIDIETCIKLWENEEKEAEYNKRVCSKCGSQLVKRKNGKTGVEFWGCSLFPKCKGPYKNSIFYDDNISDYEEYRDKLSSDFDYWHEMMKRKGML